VHKYSFNRLPVYMRLSPEEQKDDYYFDLGYFFAYSTVIYTIGLFFSTIAPLIPLICFLFFAVKYWVDKYNFMYVYPPEFDSMQPFGKYVAHF